MNIRKIIREEVDEFEWADVVEDALFDIGDKFHIKIKVHPTLQLHVDENSMWSDEYGTPYVHTIVEFRDDGKTPVLINSTRINDGRPVRMAYKVNDLNKLIRRGKWVKINDEPKPNMIQRMVNRLRESDFEWTEDITEPQIYVGKKFRENKKVYHHADDTVFYIEAINGDIAYVMGDGLSSPEPITKYSVIKSFENGEWIPVD